MYAFCKNKQMVSEKATKGRKVDETIYSRLIFSIVTYDT
jgi:hypothetical protein